MLTAEPRISGIVFDLDGTIAETQPMAVELIGSTIAAHGGPRLPPSGVTALFGPDEKGVLRSALGETWETAWEDYLGRYLEMHRLCPAPFPGMADLLESLYLRGCPLGLVTGKTATTGLLSLEFFGVGAWFRSVEGGSIDGLVKTERISGIVAEWGLDPAEVAYVGDNRLDVSEAHAAGVVAVSAAWSEFADPGILRAAGPDFMFETVAGFAAWLDERACRS